MLLAAVAPGRRTAIGGGVGLALAALKLHPASMGVWFVIRAVRDRRPEGRHAARIVIATAIAAVVAMVVVSLVLGGYPLWVEYAGVVRAGAGATIVDPRNAGLAAQLVGSVGGDDGLARSLHVVVGVLAVGLTAWAAWRRADPLESFAWATAASLATLPVTWYHYPSALLPIAAAALLRATGQDTRRVALLVTLSGVVAAIAIVWLPLLWVAIALMVAAARSSAPHGAAASPASHQELAPAAG
jgi:hypothetical protein